MNTELLIGLGFSFMLILVIIGISKISKKRKKNIEHQVKEMEKQGIYFNTSLPHVNGLPIAEGTFCNLFLKSDKIEIEANGNKFNLSKSKITDITMKTDVEIQKQLVSSAGGAVAGGLLFGALGAFIGGRTKEKKSKTVNTYLIFTYKKDETIDYIGFDVTHFKNLGKKFVEDFQTLPRKINTVDL